MYLMCLVRIEYLFDHFLEVFSRICMLLPVHILKSMRVILHPCAYICYGLLPFSKDSCPALGRKIDLVSFSRPAR